MWLCLGLSGFAVSRSAGHIRIFEVSRDTLLVAAPDGGIVDLNPAGLRMLGFSNFGDGPLRQNFQTFFGHAGEWRQITEAIAHQGASRQRRNRTQTP